MNRYYKVRDHWLAKTVHWLAKLELHCTKILPHFRALKLALAPFCADCELPMYLKYLQQDESPLDYLIYLYNMG